MQYCIIWCGVRGGDKGMYVTVMNDYGVEGRDESEVAK